MLITTLRLQNFQCFGGKPTIVDLERLTYVLGPNGAGKTSVLEALSRLFSPLGAQRTIRIDDFHVPVDRLAGDVHAELPTLWIEVDIEIPEAKNSEFNAAVPPNFQHMRLETADGAPRVRVRLTATLDAAGEVDERLEYILEVGEDGEPAQRKNMSRYDRRNIEVYYLPARRDPADHISYTTSSLIGRTLRAADWNSQRTELAGLSTEVTKVLGANGAVNALGTMLKAEWSGLHSGAFFTDPAVSFGSEDLDGVLRQLNITFSPSHGDAALSFDRLSDGQKSLLYVSLVLAWQRLARAVLNNDNTSLDIDRLQPPVHTVIALEEPENSLAPTYLGRIIRQLRACAAHDDAQALIATHAPALLRRVNPKSICFLRLNEKRESTVRHIIMPDDDETAAKYVREAIETYPELYFARLVVLGEGDSELVVLPRILAASGLAEDDASICVVPLGGRHVNHLWRLLNALDIPFVTLLDLDSARHGGGWGRIKNTAKQLNTHRDASIFTAKEIKEIPAWNADVAFPTAGDGSTWIDALEQHDVFFSAPVDLDLMMLSAFPSAYQDDEDIEDAEDDDGDAEDPEEDEVEDDEDEKEKDRIVSQVLGPKHVGEERLGHELLALLVDYHDKFGLHSKPASHLSALSQVTNDELLDGLPPVLNRLIDRIESRIAELPE